MLKCMKKEKPRIHVILHPINTIMQRKKAVNPPFNFDLNIVTGTIYLKIPLKKSVKCFVV